MPAANGTVSNASCEQCGLLRLDPLPDASAIAALYDGDYFDADDLWNG
jgi:hypothetical protein